MSELQLERQAKYVADMKAKGPIENTGIIVHQQFYESMRDVGYDNEASVILDLQDNSIEAGAQNIEVLTDKQQKGLIQQIAIVDNGIGMTAEMLTLAIGFGDTSKAAYRDGLGRFGFGLPSAGIAVGRKYTVYSCHAKEGKWHKISIDLDDLGSEILTGLRPLAASCNPSDFPDFIKAAMKRDVKGSPLSDMQHGTIVVLEKLDRTSWKQASVFEANMMIEVGKTLATFLADVTILVNGTTVIPVDVNFTQTWGRGFDENSVRAVEHAVETVMYKSDFDGKEYPITVRMTYYPIDFFVAEKDIGKGVMPSLKNGSTRYRTRHAISGITCFRNGRLLGHTWPSRGGILGRLQNNDMYWAISIEFPGELDEVFNVTTHKNKIFLSDDAWSILESKLKLKSNMAQLRKQRELDKAIEDDRLDKGRDTGSQKERHSISVLEEFKEILEANPVETRSRAEVIDKRERFQKKVLDEEVARRSRDTGRKEEQIREELLMESIQSSHKIEKFSSPTGNFFDAIPRGSQLVLLLNTEHPFFSMVYARSGVTSFEKSALELTLFPLARRLIDLKADPDRPKDLAQFENMLVQWSTELRRLLPELGKRLPDVSNKASSEDVA